MKMAQIVLIAWMVLLGMLLGCDERDARYMVYFESEGIAIGQLRTDGASRVTLPTPPEKTGHTFIGWFFDLGTWEEPLVETTWLERPLQGHATVFAHWMPNTYTVWFDHQGGTGVQQVQVLYSQAVTLPDSTRPDYRFLGWYQDAASIIPFDHDAMPDHDMTLYASWAPYVEVQVILDPAGGTFHGEQLEGRAPLHTLTLTTKEDVTGQTVTLMDATATGYRWFFKVFFRYDGILDVYEIVAVDAATTAIGDLTIPDYDVVLAVHDACLDREAYATLVGIASKGEAAEGLLLRSPQPLLTYEGGLVPLSVHSVESLQAPQEVLLRTPGILPQPIRAGHVLVGWSLNDEMVHDYEGFIAADRVDRVSYEAIWRPFSFDEFVTEVETLFAKPLSEDVSLPIYFGEDRVFWDSHAPEVLSADGRYTRPYVGTSGSITASILVGDVTYAATFAFYSEGYKPLEIPLAAGYVYRGFDQIDETTFATLDIIYTAFVTAQADGQVHGAHVLNQVARYVMPEARRHGNWVILSIAPDSAWSDIASSDATMTFFANEIVRLINQHGFDGVDIDWEFPSTAEATRFTRLMNIVHTAVKTNNPHHLVTAALGGGMWLPARYDLQNAMAYIDYANIMTYSMTSANGQYHNPLHPSFVFDHAEFKAGRTLISASVSETVTILHETYGVPREKLIMGVAFYGVMQTRTYDVASDTFGPWVRQGSVFYHHIADQYLHHPDYTAYFDETAQVPYLLKNDGTVFISYDDIRSIYAKSAYVIAEGLGGIMYWEHGTDLSGTLIRALRSSLGK